MEITMFLGPLAGAAPALVFWIAVIIFAAVVRRRGGRAESFLVAGAGLKILAHLLSIPTAFIPLWLVDKGYSLTDASTASNYCGIFVNIAGMAGILCLVYAFWVKFKMRNGTPARIPTLERGTYDTGPEY